MSDPRFKPIELPPVEPIQMPWYMPWFWPGGRLCAIAVELAIVGLIALLLHYLVLPWSALWWASVVLGGLGGAAALACAVFGLRVMERPRASAIRDHIKE